MKVIRTIATASALAISGMVLSTSIPVAHAASSAPSSDEEAVHALISELRKMQTDLDSAHRTIARKDARIRHLKNRIHRLTHEASLSDNRP